MSGHPVALADWAHRWNVPPAALAELATVTIPPAALIPGGAGGKSESYAQSRVRLQAAKEGLRLWRNNVGVLPNPDTGQPVRYGLANDSKQLNQQLKSSDLIGWRKLHITAGHVGLVVAQFTARECKPAGWRYRGDDHEVAQKRWLDLVTLDGGDAKFTTGEV